MSENTNNGCIFWTLLAAVILIISGLVINTNIISEPNPLSASPSPSTALTENTPIPEASNNYFEIENEISYAYFHTLGRPCYYILSGHVLDLHKQPFTDFVLNLKTISVEGVVPDSGYTFPGNGGFAEDGVSGWASLVPTLTNYEVWLTTTVNGMEISPHIYVPMKGCDQNRAIINFIQVKPLP